jgi:hypothetical protein
MTDLKMRGSVIPSDIEDWLVTGQMNALRLLPVSSPSSPFFPQLRPPW